uniref:Uncharacterized protein n=1 Tax=Anguilla anguilla TaxID=7936 RepID=A0A0E9SND3_ANGAN
MFRECNMCYSEEIRVQILNLGRNKERYTVSGTWTIFEKRQGGVVSQGN